MQINNTHPFEIICGVLFSMVAVVQEHTKIPNLSEIAFQTMKVIAFGILGGAFGYIGRLIAAKIHDYFKKQ